MRSEHAFLTQLLADSPHAFITGQELAGGSVTASTRVAAGESGKALPEVLFDLPAGIHEWFLEFMPEGPPPVNRAAHRTWFPPLTILAGIAGRANRGAGHVMFVGRNCWPTAQVLQKTILWDQSGAVARGPLQRCICVDPINDAQRLWTLDQALRCPGIAAIVANAEHFNDAATRRLQLAAETGRVLALLARPPWEITTASWAATRWRVTPDAGDSLASHSPSDVVDHASLHQPRWNVELLRGKGLHTLHTRWTIQWNHEAPDAQNAFHLSPVLGHPVDAPPAPRFASARSA